MREGRGEASALDAMSISCGYGTVVFAQIQLTAQWPSRVKNGTRIFDFFSFLTATGWSTLTINDTRGIIGTVIFMCDYSAPKKVLSCKMTRSFQCLFIPFYCTSFFAILYRVGELKKNFFF